MTLRLLGILVVSVCAGAPAALPVNQREPMWSGSPPFDGRPFVVTLPPAATARSCAVLTRQAGSFGEFVTQPDIVEAQGLVEIKTVRTTETLKAILWCRGFLTVSIDVPSLQKSTYSTSVTLVPQTSLRLTGTAHPEVTAGHSARYLDVWLHAPWLCPGANCFVALMAIATTKIAPDGSFTVDVPDLLSDPVVRRDAAAFHFRTSLPVPERSSDSLWLRPMIPVATSYPNPVVLRLDK